MLPRHLIYILSFFDIFGYRTGVTMLSIRKTTASFILFVHFVLALLFTSIGFHLIVELSPLVGLIELINELIQYTVGVFTYWFIIFDSFFQHQYHLRFWKFLQKIDDKFCSQHLGMSFYIGKLIEFFTTSISLFTLLYFINTFPNLKIIFVYMALFSLCQIRLFYYIFCLTIIHHQLKMIENELIVMKRVSSLKYNQFHGKSSSYSYEFQRFKWFREYFYCINEMIKLLNKIFGWSQVAAVLCCFYFCATNLNWFYSIHNKRSTIKIICKSICKMVLKFYSNKKIISL